MNTIEKYHDCLYKTKNFDIMTDLVEPNCAVCFTLYGITTIYDWPTFVEVLKKTMPNMDVSINKTYISPIMKSYDVVSGYNAFVDSVQKGCGSKGEGIYYIQDNQTFHISEETGKITDIFHTCHVNFISCDLTKCS